MKQPSTFLSKLRGRQGSVTTGLMMAFLLMVDWQVAREPALSVFSGALPGYVLSGKLLSEPFNTIHAGSALDQPTLGKWLFWFTVTAMFSLPYTGLVGWLARRRSRRVRITFAVGVFVLGLLLLCILSWPLCWLIQYIHSMGSTPKRMFGLLYAILCGLLVIVGMVRAWRNPVADSAH